jgi:hypothetical protein
VRNIVPHFLRGDDPGGEEFISAFKKKYAGLPLARFELGTIETAIHKASSSQKPLLIYLHDSNAAMLRVFLTNTICDSVALQLLVSNPTQL